MFNASSSEIYKGHVDYEVSEDDHNMFKSDVKENLYNQGYLTIMSVGDQNIDIIGNYSGYGLKLPNKTDPRLFHINGLGKLENVSAT